MPQILILQMNPEDIEGVKTGLMEIIKWFESYEAERGSAPAVDTQSIRFLHKWLDTARRFESWEF